jgi:hypothetical protein
MSKLLAGVIAALIVGVGVAAASSLNASGDDPIRTGTVSTLDDSIGTTVETTGTTETAPTTGTGTTETGEDISGPCDEAEHANDPRCAGGAATTDDDDRGRHRGSTDDDDDDGHHGRGRGGDDNRGDGGGDDDRSGSNSGRG